MNKLLIYIMGYTASLLFSSCIVRKIQHELFEKAYKKYLENLDEKIKEESDKELKIELQRNRKNSEIAYLGRGKLLPFVLGICEQILYISALTFVPYGVGFIPIWLGIKTAGIWPTWAQTKDRVSYNTFVVGNALSLISALIGYVVIKMLLNGDVALIKGFMMPHFFSKAGFFLAVLLLLIYLIYTFKLKKLNNISNFDRCLALFLLGLLLMGPENFLNALKRWNIIFEDKIRTASKVKLGNYIEIEEVDTINVKEAEEVKKKAEEIIKEKQAVTPTPYSHQPGENLVNNGNFTIPLASPLSGWGHGLYSDLMRVRSPEFNFIWINFLDANIDISVEKTEIGNALKVMHKSNTEAHKVGIMEQRITVTPGIYKLSCLVKALDDFEEGALWIATRDDWVDPLSVDQKGPFEWQLFSKSIRIAKTDSITLTVISQGKGTSYVSNISLVKISDML